MAIVAKINVVIKYSLLKGLFITSPIKGTKAAAVTEPKETYLDFIMTKIPIRMHTKAVGQCNDNITPPIEAAMPLPPLNPKI